MVQKTNDDLLKQFQDHTEQDTRHFEAINKKLDSIDNKLNPMIEQDERVTWAARKLLTILKWLLLVLSIAVAAVAIFKGVK